MDSIYIIGDIHGCYDTFIALLKKLPENAKICLCGDLIDRGPKSRQVVQYVIDNNIDCVMGNHELMMVENPPYWSLNGGQECLVSYSNEEEDRIERQKIHLRLDNDLFETHRQWMDNLPIYIEYPECKNEDGRHLVVSHSLIHNVWKRKNDPNFSGVFKETVLWSRNFHKIKDNGDIFNVIGHTPQRFTCYATKIYANVDTGCCYKQEEYGILTALKFPEMEIITQSNIDT